MYYLRAIFFLSLGVVGTLRSNTLLADTEGYVSPSARQADTQPISLTEATLPAENGNLVVAPHLLMGGSTLTSIAPEEWGALADSLSKVIQRAHAEYSKLFGTIPPFLTTLRLMDRESFFRRTGAPRWTNALYYRGEISIPITEEEIQDPQDIVRSIRHEYAHAVIHRLSGGQCPGWLDEGLAQWAEGRENPGLKPALARWVATRAPVPLGLLQGGFTKLEVEMVPAAYAQSLYSANLIVASFGFDTISRYFRNLRGNQAKELAFREAFGITEAEFESGLSISLSEWKKRTQRNGNIETVSLLR